MKNTSDIGVGILRNIFQDRQNSIDNIVDLEIGKYILKFTVGDTSYFRLNIIQIFSIVRQKHLELVLTHSRS